MINKKKIVVIMPAFNAAQTLKNTFKDIPHDLVDQIILTDDGTIDKTALIAQSLGITTFIHKENKGYGANQKTCYREVLKTDADIIIMLHPDYQYDPRVIPFAVGFITSDICDILIGSRIRSRLEALQGGMPLYKYISNRFLATLENFVLGQNLGNFHSGFRVYKREVLENINFTHNSDDFIFDTEFLVQSIYCGYRVGDIPIPARYSKESSSINFPRSVKYGMQTLFVLFKYILQKTRLLHFQLLTPSQKRP